MFRKGAKKNDPESMFNYGISLISKPEQKNIKEAINVFENSAKMVINYKQEKNTQPNLMYFYGIFNFRDIHLHMQLWVMLHSVWKIIEAKELNIGEKAGLNLKTLIVPLI